MSEHMNTHHTRKRSYSQLNLSWGHSNYTFRNVPKTQIQKVLSSLKKYQEPQSTQAYSWREDSTLSEYTKSIGGEKAYRESAIMLRTCRKEAGLTQKELAKKLKIKQSHISQIECAKRPVGKVLAQKFSKLFDIGYKAFLSDPKS